MGNPPTELGARWIESDEDAPFATRRGAGAGAFVTRLHVRYDAAHFPEDLVFMETHDRENFQGRYVMRHPWRGTASCPAAEKYRASLPARFRKEAENLSGLTGWDAKDIAARMEAAGQRAR